MEKTYNAALIRRVQEYMEKHSISQNQLAAKVNLSSAALSSYLNQKYKGSVEAVERQLTEFFKINDEVAAVAEKVGHVGAVFHGQFTGGDHGGDRGAQAGIIHLQVVLQLAQRHGAALDGGKDIFL